MVVWLLAVPVDMKSIQLRKITACSNSGIATLLGTKTNIHSGVPRTAVGINDL